MGKRQGQEALFLDSLISAKEALKYNYINDVIPSLEDEPEWFDLKKVPTI